MDGGGFDECSELWVPYRAYLPFENIIVHLHLIASIIIQVMCAARTVFKSQSTLAISWMHHFIHISNPRFQHQNSSKLLLKTLIMLTYL